MTMIWVGQYNLGLRALLALHPPISPLTSSGQRNRASWASQPQKSVTLLPCLGGRTTKSTRACRGIGHKKRKTFPINGTLATISSGSYDCYCNWYYPILVIGRPTMFAREFVCCDIINHLTPNDHYRGRTAPISSKRCILYIYSTNLGTEYFKHGIYCPFSSLQNAVCFIFLTYLVPVLFTFYLQGVLKLKK